ncbi:tungstate transport system ATP-binding protein [Cognatiyoonia koreensis]|uniref:Tungstate transport system ATP-binding protein n=1 Tax=Cognatiyoonia koreensis TaxID=364200 RepID=A0A1I0PFB1_9RHOB|nr:ATP-binding cassette domain-containing protein [Cognatiyoonia koreensis]SEW13023.1 tungstate transport system ATP-binding protein [Cognatiyoonia koreensis]
MPGDAQILRFPPAGTDTSEGIRLVDICLQRNGESVLDKLSLTLGEKGITGLIGPNGAGKSVLLRVLTGLISPNSGVVQIAPHLGDPALVFQKPVLLRRSVKANLTHALRIAGVAKPARSGRLAELLVIAELTRQAEAPARTLSGGEQQRLAFARALASNPRLLLLDEPTASLDPAATAAIERLTRATAASGVKVIFVTHDRAQAARVCDDIAFLHKGRVTEHASVTSFFDAPQSRAARHYLQGDLLL